MWQQTLVDTLDNHLSDAEFINKWESVGKASPVIDALIQRLELAVRARTLADVSNTKVECPVCLAELQVELCEGNGMFTLTSN